MKPKILKIEGLNSFQQQQIINFEKLMKRGIFGIFGFTGSGKSTILDAVILALYGSIPRSSKNFINSNMQTASISFEFELNNNSETKIYTVERIYKRNETGGCNCKAARLYEKNSTGKINIIAEGAKSVDKQAEMLIGLKSDDFTRTVVLPQGKFSEFLTLPPKEKNNMLERILHLEQYGNTLQLKLKSKRDKFNNQLQIINSKISTYGNLTPELLASENLKYENLLSDLDNLNHQKLKLQQDFDENKQVWELQTEKNEYLQKQQSLLKDKEDIEIKKNRLELAKKADIVYPYIKALEETEKKLNSIDLDSYTTEIKNITAQLELVQKEYDKAKNIKDTEYELLLKKEANLKQALDISNKVVELQNERNDLLEQYKDYTLQYTNSKQEKSNILKDIDDNKLTLENILKDKQKINVDSEYQEKVEKGYTLETKYNDLKVKLDLVNNKIKKYDNLIDVNTENLSSVQTKLNNIQTNISNLETELKELNKINYNSDTLLDLQNKYNHTKIEYENTKLYEQDKEKLETSLKGLEQSKQKLNETYEQHTQKLKNLDITIKELKSQLNALETLNKASILAEALQNNKPCPVCGSLNHPNPAKKIENDMLSIVNNKIESNQTEYSNLQELLNNIITKISLVDKAYTDTDSKILELNQLLENKNSDKLKIELDKLNNEFNELKQKIDEHTTLKQSLDNNLKELIDEKNKLNIEKTRIIESQTKDIQTKTELELESSDLTVQQQSIYTQLNNYKAELNIDNFEHQIKIIKSNRKQYSELEKSEIEARELLDSLEKQKLSIIEQILQVKNEISKIVELGKEKAKTIEDYKLNIKKLSENNNPEEYIIEVQDRIDKIFNDEKNLNKELNDIKSKKQELDNIYMNLKNQKQTFLELKLVQLQDLQKILSENNFSSLEQAKDSIIQKSEQTNIDKVVNQYLEDYKLLDDNIQRLNKKLNNRALNSEDWENINTNLKNITIKLEQANKETAVMSERVFQMKQHLNELKALNKSKNQFVHKLDLINELILLTKGNNFIKFVSKRQMKYITKEATNYLKKITKDRYAIEIDDENDFIIRDDFAGGARRKPETLSGGEIFITSLSLALALSSQIQLKNKAPLQFFFLDEGFGSLDMNLLDTVIDALEKLHSENMNLGIISHVEELKNRIPVKLIVTPAEQDLEGSKVKLDIN